MASTGGKFDQECRGTGTYRDATKWTKWDWAVTLVLIAIGFVAGYYVPLAQAIPYPGRVIVLVGVGCSVPMIGLLLTRRFAAYFLVGAGSILIGTVYLIVMWWPETAAQYSGLASHLSGLLFFLLGRTPLVVVAVMLFAYILASFITLFLPDSATSGPGEMKNAFTFVFSGVAVAVAYVAWEVVLWLCDRFWVKGYYGIAAINIKPALWAGGASCLLCLGAYLVGTPVCKRIPISSREAGDSDRVDDFLDKYVGSWLGRRWGGVPLLLVGCGFIGLACWIGYGLLDDSWWEVPASLISMFWQVPITIADLFLHPINLGSKVLGALVGPCLTAGGTVFGYGVLLLVVHNMDKDDAEES